ncbi:MAG: AMP-binding protein [Vicinamibacterales bacterium]
MSRRPSPLLRPGVIPGAPDVTTLAGLLRWRAGATPAALAVQYLENGEHEGARLTFAGLDASARRLAAVLRARGLAGQVALLIVPQGTAYLEAFYACAYAGVVAVPAYPPRQNARAGRIEAIARASAPAVVLTTRATADEMAARLDPASLVLAPPRILVDTLTGHAPAFEEPEDPDAVVFLQYTSGSTAEPRGVALTSRNLLSNLVACGDCLGSDVARGVVSWLPLFHDFGLIGNALGAMYSGCPLYLMAPTAFLQKPLRWLQAISRYDVSHGGAPNFAYDLLVERTSPADRAMLDLSRWAVAYCGAEPVRAATLERFSAAFAPAGFSPSAWAPCYGLAESTLVVAGGPPGTGARVRRLDRAALGAGRVLDAPGAGGAELVSAGRIHPTYTLRIVDGDTGVERGPGEVGEIWVAGPSVGAGYWRDPERTAEVFSGRTADGDGPFLRTGDLGFRDGDELFVTGRVKDLLLARGQNIYPQDVEAIATAQDPAAYIAGGAAAFAVGTADGLERAVLAVEVRRGTRVDEGADGRGRTIAAAVLDELDLALDAIVFLPQGALPRTSSGKLQRHQCREAFLADAWRVVGRWSREAGSAASGHAAGEPVTAALIQSAPAADRAALVELFLRQLIAELLDTIPEAIDPERTGSELGLESMRIIEIKYRLDEVTGIEIDPMLLVEPRPLRGLAEAVAAQLDGGPS